MDSEELTSHLVIIAICLSILGLLFRSAVQAFTRQPVVAALFFIFMKPVFVAWGICEALFLEPPN
jgi:hypothetical protein